MEFPKITFFDKNGASITKAWPELSNDEIRKLLPNIITDISVARKDSSGTLTYLVAKAATQVGEYRVTVDFTKYRPESAIDAVSKEKLGDARIGVGLRMTAEIQTSTANVDLGSVFALGIAAANNRLKGTLSVHVIGVGAVGVDDLVVSNTKLDETSVQRTIEGMTAIKAKIADPSTTLTPQILWVKPTSAKVSPKEIPKNASKWWWHS